VLNIETRAANEHTAGMSAVECSKTPTISERYGVYRIE
jgi:hypothetical protein